MTFRFVKGHGTRNDFVVLPDLERFVPLEQVIGTHLGALFPGMEILGQDVFRVTRNADIEIEEDEGGDLLMAIESELTQRRFGGASRVRSTQCMQILVAQVRLAGTV